MNELVSCIIPVYNGEAFLAQAITSIIEQTHKQTQIIVVDDGSTDGTRAVVESFGARVEYVWQPNRGHAAARNHGVELARADQIAFLDADDRWLADKLTLQLERFDARPNLDGVVTLIQNVWDDPAQDAAYHAAKHRLAEPVVGYSMSCLLARRRMLERVGRFQEELPHADTLEWFLRAQTLGCAVEVVPQVLVQRRMHSGNISRKGMALSHELHLRVLKAHLDQQRRAKKQQGEA